MTALRRSPTADHVHWARRCSPVEDARDPNELRPALTVVVPTRNERRNIELVLQALPAAVEEVIVIDASDDDETMRAARRAWPGAVVERQVGIGKGAALQQGFALARGWSIAMLDGDGSMNPAEIKRFVRLLDDGFEFVKGSRFITGGGSTDMTRFRKLGHAGLLRVANMLLRAHYTDLCYGYCAFRREALARLELSAQGFDIEMQIVARAALAGLRIAEVPSFEDVRLEGRSKLHPIRDGTYILRTLLRERFTWHCKASPQAPLALEATGTGLHGGVM